MDSISIKVIREIPFYLYNSYNVLNIETGDDVINSVNANEMYDYLNQNDDKPYMYLCTGTKFNDNFVIPQIYNKYKTRLSSPLVIPKSLYVAESISENSLKNYTNINDDSKESIYIIKNMNNNSTIKQYVDLNNKFVNDKKNAIYLAIIMHNANKYDLENNKFVYNQGFYLIKLKNNGKPEKPEIQDELTEALKKCLEAESFAPGPGRKYNASYNSNVSESFEPSWYL